MKEKEIIRRLIMNPRASYVELAKDLNISPETVRQKILGMLNKGILKIYCVPDTKHFGVRRLTFILSAPLVNKAEIIDKLKEMPFVLELRSGLLSNTIIMDAITNDADRDTPKILETFNEMGLEVKEVCEAEHVHFDPMKILQE